MHSGFRVTNWKALYDFIPLFWINTVLIEIISTAVHPQHENSSVFITKLVSSAVTGLLFDLVPTKNLLLSLFLISTIAGAFTNWAAAFMSAAMEVVSLSYFCEVLVDNCKFMGLAEIITLQFVSNAVGLIFRWTFSSWSELYYFFPACNFVLFIVNLAIFQAIPQNKRPLFIETNEKIAIPRPFGVVICFLVVLTAGAHTVIYPMISNWLIFIEILPEVLKIIVVPLTFFVVLRFLRFKKISFILIFFLAAGLCFWLCFLWEYSEWLGFLGITITSAYCKCAGLVLLSRVLGPYHNGKFFGLAIGIQYIFGCFFISDWWLAFSLGVSASVLTVTCLAPGLKFCEYHRDYAIGMVSLDSPLKKKTNFRITLQRASVLET